MLISVLAFITGAFIAGTIVFFKLKAQAATEKAQLQADLAALTLKNDLLSQNLIEQKNVMLEARKQQEELANRMNTQFEVMAQKIFEEKSTKFTDQNQKNISSILEPLKERIKDFEKKVEETYSTERSERGMLRGELSKLMELNKVMSAETQNLTRALKGEVKTQGNWGELILENI
ncbi:MAG: DNA recombination protein RmuC, partial [Bdellovibrio sp.]